jgi:hypothetical protein
MRPTLADSRAFSCTGVGSVPPTITNMKKSARSLRAPITSTRIGTRPPGPTRVMFMDWASVSSADVVQPSALKVPWVKLTPRGSAALSSCSIPTTTQSVTARTAARPLAADTSSGTTTAAPKALLGSWAKATLTAADDASVGSSTLAAHAEKASLSSFPPSACRAVSEMAVQPAGKSEVLGANCWTKRWSESALWTGAGAVVGVVVGVDRVGAVATLVGLGSSATTVSPPTATKSSSTTASTRAGTSHAGTADGRATDRGAGGAPETSAGCGTAIPAGSGSGSGSGSTSSVVSVPSSSSRSWA